MNKLPTIDETAQLIIKIQNELLEEEIYQKLMAITNLKESYEKRNKNKYRELNK